MLDTPVEECSLVDQAPPSKLLGSPRRQLQHRTTPATASASERSFSDAISIEIMTAIPIEALPGGLPLVQRSSSSPSRSSPQLSLLKSAPLAQALLPRGSLAATALMPWHGWHTKGSKTGKGKGRRWKREVRRDTSGRPLVHAALCPRLGSNTSQTDPNPNRGLTRAMRFQSSSNRPG